MAEKTISSGTVHKMPQDLKKVIASSPKAREAWEDISPIARNEWICWVEDAKKDETRIHRIERLHNELMQGKRRPCCWIGCIHRKDKPISPSVKSILSRKNR